ncbi:isopenicillin-N n-acyltransferase [Fusarium pseudoanthophilum]|uniref:Isopenicillin-N n-acyltransferase n=1 Tax=Fusarium pseudoanthophilum TaxID=48495 RepID=A0A8H5KNA1_9HYPO|nr:isopenicillin-N n-acyltransferase [Fusarium pseudoanthophilum]
MNWEAVRQEAQQYIQPLQKLFPRYAEELQGLADGAGFELVDIVALNVRTEITFGLYTRVPSAPIQTDGCTSAAYRQPNGEVLLAQNWDWQPEQAPNLFICHISQPGTDIPDISMVTEGGVIGKIGINSSGVGTCLNAIRARGVDNTKIPIHLALRTALESHSAREAAEKLYEVGTAGSGHILVSDPSEAIDEPGWIPDSTDRIKRIAQLLDERLVTSTIDHSSFFDFFKDEQGYPTAINRDQFSPGNGKATLFTINMDLAKRKAIVTMGRPTNWTERIELSPGLA